ncbi:hypothetical protein ACLQ95_11525, partial [Gallibacterium anatis]|uniref:hypothetical protein n=1 Tax=Gallibacterium anatis TaxID=750 RepID=UPI0039FD9AC3
VINNTRIIIKYKKARNNNIGIPEKDKTFTKRLTAFIPAKYPQTNIILNKTTIGKNMTKKCSTKIIYSFIFSRE